MVIQLTLNFMYFKANFKYNKKFLTTTMIIIIFVTAEFISCTSAVFSQTSSQVQKGYKIFLKGQPSLYERVISVTTIFYTIYTAFNKITMTVIFPNIL